MRKAMGWLLFLIGCWMLISPQAILGLKQLKWIYDYSFPGEIAVGIIVICIAFYLIDIYKVKKVKADEKYKKPYQ